MGGRADTGGRAGIMNRRRRGRRGRRESDKGDFVSRDYGPSALALGNKGRSKALEWLPRNVLRTWRRL